MTLEELAAELARWEHLRDTYEQLYEHAVSQALEFRVRYHIELERRRYVEDECND